mmetsp:Transcript_21918/g.28382  ORF Transcript_21918/g.28382 Transcript_21918/m.28382 type:complete len:252 (+) Transcript_21918:51-806(+)
MLSHHDSHSSGIVDPSSSSNDSDAPILPKVPKVRRSFLLPKSLSWMTSSKKNKALELSPERTAADSAMLSYSIFDTCGQDDNSLQGGVSLNGSTTFEESFGSASEESPIPSFVEIRNDDVDFRKNYFNDKTWWMVDLESLDTLPKQGATYLVACCMHNLKWTEAHTRRVLRAYKQFLLLHQEEEHDGLAPCSQVQLMWREHAMDEINYTPDCMQLCGRTVEYTGALSNLQKTNNALNTRFGEKVDETLWID